jgi:FlaA1/EpsC-like NDP-sugar epimerase
MDFMTKTSHSLRRVLAMPRGLKQLIMAAADTVACLLALWLAINYNRAPWPQEAVPQLWLYVMYSVLAPIVFACLGLYRAVFRYTSLGTVVSTARAIAIYVVILVVLIYLLPGHTPWQLAVMQPWLLFTFMVGGRSVIRYTLGTDRSGRASMEVRPRLFIYGAGASGAAAAQAVEASHEFVIVGFLDDDDRLVGRHINGHPIHSPRRLESLITQFSATDVLLAMPTITRARRNSILTTLRQYPLHVRTLPSMSVAGMSEVKAGVQELDVEDLLGREPVSPNPILMRRHNAGRTVLVTGAGGSIGSELCRQLLQLKPERLLLLEHSEFALYAIHDDLQRMASRLGLSVEVIPLLGSVCDARRVDEVLNGWPVDIIYHAAAYKHVPMVEHNPAEGLRNNTFGTLVCAVQATRHGVGQFVLVSTDKAVRPTNVMGASKRLAELILQALASAKQVRLNINGLPHEECCMRTQYCMVRFGNVLGSSGSVVPLFRQQIRRGGPLTVTHEEVTRYFMTIPEAAQLVIQAGAMATGGDVFVLDMGQPIRILDLARRMVELSGLKVQDAATPDGDIAITVSGLRPGEKLYEELLIGNQPEGTEHPSIMKAREHYFKWPELQERLRVIQAAMEQNDVPALRNLLMELVSGYQPERDIVDWLYQRNDIVESLRSKAATVVL